MSTFLGISRSTKSLKPVSFWQSYSRSKRADFFFWDTLYICVTGIPVSLLLNATDLELPGRISRVQFIDLHGDVLTEIPTQLYETRPALYNVSNILTPAQFFYIKVMLPTAPWFPIYQSISLFVSEWIKHKTRSTQRAQTSAEHGNPEDPDFGFWTPGSEAWSGSPPKLYHLVLEPCPTLQKISSKSVHKFSCNPTDRQTNRPNQKHNLLLRRR